MPQLDRLVSNLFRYLLQSYGSIVAEGDGLLAIESGLGRLWANVVVVFAAVLNGGGR
ncbi:hypothetical protein HJG54_24190 [Leptolyngbya sp. NK1-12]|uniref:Uncharacterized protein n=1 Tax=Leptolyngbya sp. NK1-12 TaxID=2547451 RepID=A0AA96WI77_9CYAN|nr:hypothetical protein [Leptolyngbya sp. NK1-12]WNZ25630.1 hypothetical protein HJG54_24190 [Leptolyngbya sp. NK1-12]